MKVESKLKSAETYILYVVIFLLPLVMAPIFSNFFTIPKLALVIFGVSLIVVSKTIRFLADSSLSFSTGVFDVPVILFVGAYVAATIFQTPNKMDALLLPGITTAVFFGGILYFLTNQLAAKERSVLGVLMFASMVLVSLISLLSFASVFSAIPQLPEIMKQVSFSPTGGPIPNIVFLTPFLVLGLSYVFSEKETHKKTFYLVSTAFIFFGIIVSIVIAFSGKYPSTVSFLSLKDSWSIAVDTIKSNPLFGSGPGNYTTAFNLFRPISFNSTPLWSIKFSTARNYYLTAFTETGVLGLAALFLLFYSIVNIGRKTLKENKLVGWSPTDNVVLLSLLVFVVLLAIFPATPGNIVYIFIFLSLVATTEKLKVVTLRESHHESKEPLNKVPVIILGIPVLIAAAVIMFNETKVLQSETFYHQALVAITKNDGKMSYDKLRAAITANPYVDRYHSSYSQVNLALASTIAQKVDLSDDEKNTLTQLVQQAIREAKVAASLNPTRASNWNLLGGVYNSINTLTAGADNFAIQAYTQAVNLDPLNPNYRIALGGVLYRQKEYDKSIEIFQKVTNIIKPDYPNGHYNLAFAYRDKGDTDKAISELSIVLSLVDKNSSDYQLAKTELDNLQKQKKNAPAGTSENLTPPSQETTNPSGTKIDISPSSSPAPTPAP